MFSFNILDILYTLPALIIALTFHEFSHGFVAYHLGDMTAKNAGRLTLNPVKHIDPIGFFMFLFFRFGWAKPVPYNSFYFKNRRMGTLLVAIAGPLSNILLSLLSLIILYLFQPQTPAIYTILYSLYIYNLILAVFNLIPIPPLDGSKIVASLLPSKQEMLFWKYERYGYVFLLILIVTDFLDRILFPAIYFVEGGLLYIVSIIFKGAL